MIFLWNEFKKSFIVLIIILKSKINVIVWEFQEIFNFFVPLLLKKKDI